MNDAANDLPEELVAEARRVLFNAEDMLSAEDAVKVIARALMAERERAARIAREHHRAHTPGGLESYDVDIATAILNSEQKP